MFIFLYDKFTRTTYTNFYHNRSGFVDCISKNILVCFFRFTVYIVCAPSAPVVRNLLNFLGVE